MGSGGKPARASASGSKSTQPSPSSATAGPGPSTLAASNEGSPTPATASSSSASKTRTRTTRRKTDLANKNPGASTPPVKQLDEEEAQEEDEETRKRREARRAELSSLALVVVQQPERARLCSFKEENETNDRRPVDPPPVIELTSDGDFPNLLDSTSFFIRASLVAAEQSPDPKTGENVYPTVKTPTGANATAGEVIQTPERLRHLDGRPGALCIFAKLSVRLPGVFRLKFTLYETAQDGIIEITHTISELFEVFSPKLFKGMHESTALTRHLATQGLKVKLRTEASGHKGSNRRRAARQQQEQRTASPGLRTTPLQQAPPPHLRYAVSLPPSIGPASAPPYPPPHGRSLIWPGRAAAASSTAAPYDYDSREYEHLRKMRRTSHEGRGEPRGDPRDHPRHRERDDGMFALTDISSRLDFSLPSPSSDLSAFSLSHSGRPVTAPGFYRREWEPRREFAPGDDGFPPMPGPSSHGPPPHSSGGPPPSHGHYSHAPPPPPPSSHSSRPLSSHGRPLSSHGRPLSSHGRPMSGHDRPPSSHGRQGPPADFALPRLPRIVPSDHHPIDHHPYDHHPHHGLAPPPHHRPHSPHAPPPSHISHAPHTPHTPHTPHAHTHPHHNHSMTSSPPPTLPPIRPRSPYRPYEYDRDPRSI